MHYTALDAILMDQHNEEDSATRRCPCGETVTWSGADPMLEAWTLSHRIHVAQHFIALRERVATLERALDQYGDYDRYHDQIRRLLGLPTH